jgi:hypothetical protein
VWFHWESKALRDLLMGLNNLGRRNRKASEEVGQKRRLFSQELRPQLEFGYGST